jgi:hypothetical protein
MPNLEIVTTDEDAAWLTVSWRAGEEATIEHEDNEGFKSIILLQVAEAKQIIAALSAFVEGKHNHASDCALHSSPAYPIEACSCTVSSTHQRCAKCGCETKGEAALVDGKIWCHPCADDALAVISTDRGGDFSNGRTLMVAASPDYPEILRLYRKYSVGPEPLWQVFVRVGRELEAMIASNKRERCPTCGHTDLVYGRLVDPWCADPWHGDDHLRRGSTVTPADRQTP